VAIHSILHLELDITLDAAALDEVPQALALEAAEV
jgi:hypothetical protein